MRKLEDAGTQLEHVPGVDETDHTEVTSCLLLCASARYNVCVYDCRLKLTSLVPIS